MKSNKQPKTTTDTLAQDLLANSLVSHGTTSSHRDENRPTRCQQVELTVSIYASVAHRSHLKVSHFAMNFTHGLFLSNSVARKREPSCVT